MTTLAHVKLVVELSTHLFRNRSCLTRLVRDELLETLDENSGSKPLTASVFRTKHILRLL